MLDARECGCLDVDVGIIRCRKIHHMWCAGRYGVMMRLMNDVWRAVCVCDGVPHVYAVACVVVGCDVNSAPCEVCCGVVVSPPKSLIVTIVVASSRPGGSVRRLPSQQRWP